MISTGRLRAQRLRWQRFFQHARDHQPTRNLVWLVSAGALLIGGLISAGELNSEHVKNELLTRFVSEEINQLAKHLNAETLDWATWDETYNHLLHRNPNYYKERYNQYTFYRSPFVATFDRRGSVYSSSTWDYKKDEPIPLAASKISQLKAQIPAGNPLAPVTILARYAGQPFLVSLQPVQPTVGHGAAIGRLLFVRPLDRKDVSFSRISNLGQALGVMGYYYGKPAKKSLNPLATLEIVVPLQQWQGVIPMKLVILREPQERWVIAHVFMALFIAITTIVTGFSIKSYTRLRQAKLLKLRNQRSRIKLQRDLKNSYYLDELTGLQNEAGFHHKILSQGQRFPNFRRVIIQMDLDRFALINNGLGQDFGNKILVIFANRIREITHSSAVIARLGGDKFACCLIGTSTESLRSEVANISDQLNNIKTIVDGQIINIMVSLGAAFVKEDQPYDCLHDARVACSIAKLEGGCRHTFFDTSSKTTGNYLALHRHNQELISAIHDQRIELHAQHAWSLQPDDNFSATYVELLCRIRDQRTNSPYWRENLIEAANACGSLQILDQAVLEIAFANLAALIQRNAGPFLHPQLIFAINITPETLLSPGFSQAIKQLASAHVINPASICLEITEQAALRNPAETAKIMVSLRKLGFRVALDDFGTGMTSLSHLRDLPLDYVKIDKSFIRKLLNDPASRVIIGFVAELSKEIGFQTIAEGVEDPSYLLELQKLGISIAQGYLITRPRPFLCEPEHWIFGQSGKDVVSGFHAEVLESKLKSSLASA